MIAPGAGLVVLRREWLGLTLAALFVLPVQFALWGLLLFPGLFSSRISMLSGLAAVMIWLGAQWLTWVRARTLLDDKARQELKLLHDRVVEAMQQGQLAEAGNLLQVGMKLDDEDVDLRVQWARLMTLTGQTSAARKGWKTVLRLSPDGPQRTEALAAVDRMQT